MLRDRLKHHTHHFVMRKQHVLTIVLASLALVAMVVVIAKYMVREDRAVVVQVHQVDQGLDAYRSLNQRTGDNSHAEKRFAVNINRPAGPPVVHVLDDAGVMQTLSCTVCHTLREPDVNNRSTADLDQFHQDISFVHGDLSCLACHNPDDYNTLRLADQRSIAFRDVMTLCAQCHGPQHRDYLKGAHGGMNGYWDLSRGPRTRNGCTDCHNPHSPSFPAMVPTFKPSDRFLSDPDLNAKDMHD